MALFDINLRLPPEFFTAVDKLVTTIVTKGNAIMATVQEAKDAATAAAAGVAALKTEVAEEVVILGDIKKKLDDLIAAGAGATAADLQEIVDTLAPVAPALTQAVADLDTAGNAAAGTAP